MFWAVHSVLCRFDPHKSGNLPLLSLCLAFVCHIQVWSGVGISCGIWSGMAAQLHQREDEESGRSAAVCLRGAVLSVSHLLHVRWAQAEAVAQCSALPEDLLTSVSSCPGFPPGLKLLLEDESIMKVGLGIEGDKWKLLSDYDIKLKNIVELSDLANETVRCLDIYRCISSFGCWLDSNAFLGQVAVQWKRIVFARLDKSPD